MAIGSRIDRDAFHAVLWGRTNSRGRVTFRLDRLAEELQLSMYQISRIMVEFVEQGRARKLSTTPRGTMYVITDPDNYQSGTS